MGIGNQEKNYTENGCFEYMHSMNLMIFPLKNNRK